MKHSMKTDKIKLNNGFAPYPEYKDSGIEWIGKIPKEWKFDILQHHFSKVKRTGFQNEELLSVYRDRGVIVKSSRSDNHNKASEDLSTYQLVEKGDLAINKMKAWQGSVAISNHKGIVSPAYYVCKPISNNYSQFFHYLLRSDIYIKQYEKNSGGVRNDQWDLNYERFRKIEAILPPLETQKKIAEYLDEKTELIDRIIEWKKRLIELLREKRTAIINQAVTKGLDPNVELVDSGIEWIGKIPKGWEVKKLKHFVKTTTSGVWGENQLNNVDDVRCLRIADFNYDNLSYSEADTVRNIAGLKKEKILKKGDILVEKSGGGEKTPVGRAILFHSTEKMVCANFIDIVRVDASEMIPEYFAILLSALYAKRVNVKYIKQNTGIQNLDLKAYFSEYIGFPGLDIQHKIVEYSHLKIMQSFELQSKVEKSIKTLKEFKSSLISNVVTGKVRVK